MSDNPKKCAACNSEDLLKEKDTKKKDTGTRCWDCGAFLPANATEWVLAPTS